MNEAPTPHINQPLSTLEPVPQQPPQTGNAYPFLRRFFLVLLVVIVLGAVLFLLYLNGRSLYTYGL